MCSHRNFRSAHIVAISMIGSKNHSVIILVAERNDVSDDAIQFFYRFDDGIHLSGMTYHIAVSEIYDDEIEVFGVRDELFVDLLCGHLRIQIIRRHFMRRNENIFFAIKHYLSVAVEEFRDVSEFLGLCEMQLTKLMLGNDFS